MASTDARPVPRKNVAYRVTFPILDADGDLVTGATGLDSEISIDGGTFGDCTNEATEIATSSGMYYLDLTSDEMNGDTVAVIVKTSSVGAKTTPIVFYPEEVGDIRVNVSQWNGTTVPSEHTAGYPVVTVKDGTGTGEIDTTSGGVAVTATSVRAAVGLASANLDTQLTAIDDYIDTEVAAIKAKTDNLPADPADASDIAASFSTVNTTLGTIAGYIDTEVAAIKAKTDQLTFTTPNQVDATTVTSSDKTGYSLAAGGLDAIAVTDPGAPASHNTVPKMLVALWRWFYKKTTLTSTELKTYADNGTSVNSTAAVSDNGTTQTKDAAS